MPIYEYACDACGNQFEVKQKFSDPPVAKCHTCGEPVRKLISAPGIMFKGTGWYVTDYSNKLKDPSQSKSAGASEEKKGEKTDGAGEKVQAKSEKGKSDTTQSPTSGSVSSTSTGPSSPSSSS